jgi:propionyl-CoA carboxylase alpha chain
MLAKVIAAAPTRAEAAGRLALALERLHIGGVTTNRSFLAAVLRDDAFLAGDTTTDFIDRVAPAATPALTGDDRRRLAVAAALWLQGADRADAPVLGGLPCGWRNARLPSERRSFSSGDDEPIVVTYRARRDGSFLVDDLLTARIHGWTRVSIDLELDGRRSRHRITRSVDRLHVQHPTGTLALDVAPRFVVPGTVMAAGGLVAPMPGVATDVRVALGEEVKAKQVLVVLEAMKMEHHITAPLDGTVSQLLVSPGDHVENGEVLLVLEPLDDPPQEEGS